MPLRLFFLLFVFLPTRTGINFIQLQSFWIFWSQSNCNIFFAMQMSLPYLFMKLIYLFYISLLRLTFQLGSTSYKKATMPASVAGNACTTCSAIKSRVPLWPPVFAKSIADNRNDKWVALSATLIYNLPVNWKLLHLLSNHTTVQIISTPCLLLYRYLTVREDYPRNSLQYATRKQVWVF